MANWTDELKAQVIKMYEDGEPTPANSTELVKEIAEELEQSANGVRQVLVQAGVYVKKDVAVENTKSTGKTTTTKTSDGTKRVSKESQLDALRQAITNVGGEVDEEIISKLTGKAATYLASILTKK